MSGTENKHDVPRKQWRRWSRRARFVFDELYGAMVRNPWVFQGPEMAARPPSARAWKVVAWNAAWIAADAADALPAYSEVVELRRGREVARRALKAA